MSSTLRKLEVHIEKLEELREGYVPSREQQEAHEQAFWAWASCLPETALQLRAGLQRNDILKALLEPWEEEQVPIVTDLSGIVERLNFG